MNILDIKAFFLEPRWKKHLKIWPDFPVIQLVEWILIVKRMDVPQKGEKPLSPCRLPAYWTPKKGGNPPIELQKRGKPANWTPQKGENRYLPVDSPLIGHHKKGETRQLNTTRGRKTAISLQTPRLLDSIKRGNPSVVHHKIKGENPLSPCRIPVY